jgi:hypothetical protein
MTAYRTLAREPETSEVSVFEYFPEKARAGSSTEAWVVWIAPIFVTVVLVSLLPSWAAPGAVALGVAWWWWRRRLAKKPHMTLRVRNDRLRVVDARGRLRFDCTLEELDDVLLDTKTIERVQENPTAAPGAHFINATVGPAIDTSRIELVTYDEVLPLTEHYTSSIDATDWYTKIRRFLRKNGWVALLDRDEEEPPSSEG